MLAKADCDLGSVSEEEARGCMGVRFFEEDADVAGRVGAMDDL